MMKKTLFVIILIAVFSLHHHASAQDIQVEWSEPVWAEEKHGMQEIGCDDEFYYRAIFEGSLNKSYYVMSISKSTQKSEIRKVTFKDDKGNGCWENDEFGVEESTRAIIDHNIMVLEGKVIVFSRKWDKKTQTMNLYACALNKELEPDYLPNLIASYPDYQPRPSVRPFTLQKVGNKILVRYSRSYRQANEIISILMDKDLNTVPIKEFGEDDPLEERLLDEKGNLVMIKGSEGSGSMDYKVIKYDRVSGEASFSMVSIPDIHSCSIKSLLDSNNTLCLVAYYLKLTPDQKEQQGFYLINCDLDSMKEVSRKHIVPSNEMLDKSIDRTKHKPVWLTFNKIIKQGTSMYLLMQKEYLDNYIVEYHNIDGHLTNTTVLVPHYDDIVAFCIDTEKESLTWVKSIHKQQVEPVFFKFMCSYMAVVNHQQLYILFNTDANEAAKNVYTTPGLKEKVALMCITINQEGELKTTQLTAPAKGMVMDINGKQLEGGNSYKVSAYKYAFGNICSKYADGMIYFK